MPRNKKDVVLVNFQSHNDHARQIGSSSSYQARDIISRSNKAAFEYRSYESDCGLYAKGVSEKLQDKYIEPLKGIQ